MSTKKKNAARAVADVTSGLVLAEVEIAAPPERVFRALTDGKEIARWWGSPDTYQTESWVSEFRAGSPWVAKGRNANGEPFEVSGEYLAVDPPKRIVHTWRAPWDGGNVTTVTYRLEPLDDGRATRVTLRHEGFAERADSCRVHGEGWSFVLGLMAAHVAPNADAKYFFARLVPPRPSFAMDMSEDERATMNRHVVYWTNHLREGRAVAFGPVADPKGPWGMAILRVEDERELSELLANDPAIADKRGLSYETLPMARVVY